MNRLNLSVQLTIKTVLSLWLTLICLDSGAQSGKVLQDTLVSQIQITGDSIEGNTLSVKPISLKNADRPVTPRSFIMPGAIFTVGAALTFGHLPIQSLDSTTQDEIQEDLPGFRTITDNFLQFAPALAVFGLNAAGVKGKHTILQSTEYYILALFIMAGSTKVLKELTHVQRPDYSDYYSFPSGHTANAFLGAEFLNQEYGFRSAWYPVAGYTAATVTGALRMANNRHWLGDIIAGAGLGILSTRLSYWLVPKINKAFHRDKASKPIPAL